MKNIKRVFKDPRLILIFILSRYCHWMNDELYLKILYFLRMGKMLHLNPPVTYNEKLQWLKLHDRHPEYTQMVDKAMAKEYAAGIIGNEYIIPTLGVWDKFEDIDFDTLPNQFVLKCTHDSGGLVLCKDKQSLDIVMAKKKINASLRKNYFYGTREYPYKNVKPCILAEKYMIDESGIELKDYKIFCFNGEPRFIEVDFERFIKHKRNIYTVDWALMDLEIKYPSDRKKIVSKPSQLKTMLNIASKLSKGLPHVRVDLYVVYDKVYFGELTFFHESGMAGFKPKEWESIIGEWLKLPY